MSKNLLWAFGVVLLFSQVAWAQETDSDFSNVPPPKPPYVARAPQRSAWTIEFVPTQSGNGPSTPNAPGGASPGAKLPSKQLKRQNWTKSGTLMRCVNQWSDGSTTEDWVVGSVLLSQDLKRGIHLYSPQADPRYHDFGSSDFALLDWITPKDYDKVVKHGNDICYRFNATTVVTSPAESGPHNKTLAELNAPTSPTSVFISVQSGLPVEIDNGSGKYLYHFITPPDGELKLPDSFGALWKTTREH